MRALFLVPDLFGPPGGIARYCRLVARVLCEARCIQRLDVLALWDRRATEVDARYLFGRKASYRPFAGDQQAFAATSMRAVVRGRYDLLLSGHVGFAPLLFTPSLGCRHAKRVTFIYGVDAWDRLPIHKRTALRASNPIISISQYTAKRATEANDLDPLRIKLLYNCLDPGLEPGNLNGLHARRAASSPTLVTVSRLASAEDKGHVAVLRALPKVVEKIPDVRYVIVGDGDLRPTLENHARAFGVADRTQFVGTVSDAEVIAYLDSSHAYVMPGRNEGFGFVFLEAMARGLPVIAGIHDAAPEVLGPDAGVVVDPDNAQQVAESIIQVLSDNDLRGRIIDAGRKRLDRLFRYPTFKEILLEHLGAVSSDQGCEEL